MEPEQKVANDSNAGAFTVPSFKSLAIKWKTDQREFLKEFYRRYLHIGVVTLLMVFNLFITYSALVIYISNIYQHDGDPIFVLTLLLGDPPHWLINIGHLFYIPFDTWGWSGMLALFYLPLLNWLYSTVTQPIKKKYKTIISWTTERGRVVAAILSAVPFSAMFWAMSSIYIRQHFWDFFASLRNPKEYLVVHSMESFNYILIFAPMFLTFVFTYMVIKQFYLYEDLKKQFLKFEFPLLARHSFSLKNNRADVIIGWDKKTKKPIVLHEQSRYLHEIVKGATGTGKTSTTILIRVAQDLIRIARGKKQSLVFLEPKGDAIRDVLKICSELGIPDEKILVVDPVGENGNIKFNPWFGPMEAVSEGFRGTLNSLTENQDPFFKDQQGETAAYFSSLAKLRFKDEANIEHVFRIYNDPRFMADCVEDVRAMVEAAKVRELNDAQIRSIQRYERILDYFENDVIEYQTIITREGEVKPVEYPPPHRHAGRQVVINKKEKFIAGAKKYLNDMAMNDLLSNLLITKAGDRVLNLDEFLSNGGILLVNTALGELEELSILLGQLFIRQFQSAVFRIEPEDEEHERIPTFFYVDEFPLYANPAFQRLLTLGRAYKVGTLIAIQDLGQLEAIERGYSKTIITNARNRTVFGGGEFTENEYFSKLFGEEEKVEESLNESTTPVTVANQSWGLRYNTQRKMAARFSPTDIMELPFKHMIVQLIDEEQSVAAPVLTTGKFLQEMKLLNRFVNIGKIELETKNYKPLNIGNYVGYFNTLITSTMSGPQKQNEELTQTEDNPSTNVVNERVTSDVPTSESDISLQEVALEPDDFSIEPVQIQDDTYSIPAVEPMPHEETDTLVDISILKPQDIPNHEEECPPAQETSDSVEDKNEHLEIDDTFAIADIRGYEPSVMTDTTAVQALLERYKEDDSLNIKPIPTKATPSPKEDSTRNSKNLSATGEIWSIDDIKSSTSSKKPRFKAVEVDDSEDF